MKQFTQARVVSRVNEKVITYFLIKKVRTEFEKAVSWVKHPLQDEGFGILTEIYAKSTIKNKLDVDFRKYRIPRACNPAFADKAPPEEDKVGTMLSCNVIVQETVNGRY